MSLTPGTRHKEYPVDMHAFRLHCFPMAVSDVKDYAPSQRRGRRGGSAPNSTRSAKRSPTRWARTIAGTVQHDPAPARAGRQGRAVLLFSGHRPAWVLGTGLLAAGKIIENMELGHNVMHGQWDWMNDPRSTPPPGVGHRAPPSTGRPPTTTTITRTPTSSAWTTTWAITVRSARDPRSALAPRLRAQHRVWNAVLAFAFQWAACSIWRSLLGTINFLGWPEQKRRIGQFLRKARRQVGKDYVWWPMLSGDDWKTTLTVNATANVIRNLWSNVR